MQVILLQNIKGVGRIGDIKNVNDGYAKNFLFPKKLAKTASENSIKEVEALRAKSAQEMEIRIKEAGQIAEKLKDSTIELKRKLSKTGTLFAAITAKEIAKALSEKVGAKIDTEMVNLGEFQGHIKHAGSHNVPIELTDNISASVNIIVIEE